MTQLIADQIAQDLTHHLNAWHSAPEKYDDALDAQIHKWYFDILTDKTRRLFPPKSVPYFSPSSANSDPRSLYEKMLGAKRDGGIRPAHQGRWVRIGTAIGDVIQRDILFAEKYVDKARFSFERNGFGEPVFEDFAKVAPIIEHGGKSFALFGTCDGILRYISEDGEVIRVGLEVKSKQTTYSMTSGFSARKGPKDDHVKQCVCYSKMYGVDYYVILYVNASKKSWNMSEEDFAKTPDIQAFGLHITDEMRDEVLGYFAELVERVDTKQPPELDLDKWTFNDFKRTIAMSLSEDELARLRRQISAVMRSGLPDHVKRKQAEALEFIERIRKEGEPTGETNAA